MRNVYQRAPKFEEEDKPAESEEESPVVKTEVESNEVVNVETTKQDEVQELSQ